MRDARLADVARGLHQAAVTRVAIAPPTELVPELTTEQAYRIQQLIVAAHLRTGEKVVGYKVGLTSRAMQDQLGVHEPDYSPILSSMLLDDGARIRRSELIQPRVEAEIAFELGTRLRGPGVTADDVLAATSRIVAAIEVIDSRVADWRITLPDTIADLASSARVVLGSDPVSPDGMDLAKVEAVVERDGEVVERGVGAAVLGHPAEAVAWAANTLGRLGATFEPGHVVMPGALHASIPIDGHGEFRAQVDGVGSVSVSFHGDEG